MFYRDLVIKLQKGMNAQGAKLNEDGDPGTLTQRELLKFDVTLALTKDENFFDARTPDFKRLWETCENDAPRAYEIASAVNLLQSNKDTYDKIAALADCAWWVPAIVNYRESGGRMDTYLHNGQRLGYVTTIVPIGIFFRKDQFVEAAVDALRRQGLVGCKSVPEFLPKAEGFNGLGYRSRIGDHGVVELSPYVWAGTNHHDETGKFIKDGPNGYSPTAHEFQLGVAAILKGMNA